MRSWRDASIQTKMLVIILPMIVGPMLILAAVGFVSSYREAAKTSHRYLAQRENDLRTLAENAGIATYFNNRAYGLTEEAEVPRRELEASLKRFADRSNSAELIYRVVRYVDQQGQEAAKVVDGTIRGERGQVGELPFFGTAKTLGPGRTYLSPIGPTMVYAMPVYQASSAGREPIFQGVVVLDFVYPVREFQRTTWVILGTFLVITALSLSVALYLTIVQVRRLTDPIRRLARAANLIAAGQRSVKVAIDSGDEIGRLASSFDEMATSLEVNEAALQRKVAETQTLYEIGQEISAHVSLEPTLNRSVERARELLQAEVSLLALRQGDTDTFAMQAVSGPGAADLTGVRFRPGEGIGGRVVPTGAPVTVGDYLAEYPDSPFRDVVAGTGHRAYVAVPLKARGAVLGVLYVISSTPNKFAEGDRQLLSALADQAAVAIENAALRAGAAACGRAGGEGRGSHARAPGGEPAVGRGVAPQVRVPRQHVARAADAAQRHHRLQPAGDAPAQGRPFGQAVREPREDSGQRRPSPEAHQRHSGSL